MGHLTRRQGDVLAGARDFLLRHPRARPAHREAPLRSADVRDPGGDRAARSTPTRSRTTATCAGGRARGRGADARLLPARARRRPGRRSAARVGARAGAPASRASREVDASFITFNGELALTDPRLFAERPSEMVRLFRVAVAEKLPVYGHTRELVAETIARDPAPLAARSGRARGCCSTRSSICATRAQPSAFEVMHQLGILSALMPEWAPCTGARPARPLSRVHRRPAPALRARDAEAARARRARGGAPARDRAVARGQAAGAAAARHAAPRRRQAARQGPRREGRGRSPARSRAGSACPTADVELAEFLVRQHLTMSHLSQRRDLVDPEVDRAVRRARRRRRAPRRSSTCSRCATPR